MSFLLTGSTGVLGRKILEVLEASPSVDSVAGLRGDINDRAEIRRFMATEGPFSHLIHAAAVVATDSVSSDLINAYQTNVIGTGNVVTEFLQSNKGGHVTYVSSSHIYGTAQTPISETTRPDPGGSYGRTKLSGEYVADDVSSALNGRLCIARLFSLYSDEQTGSFLLPSLKNKVRLAGLGAEIEIPGWNNIRDFAPAEVHARAVAHLSCNSLFGIYNVGSGKGQSVLDFSRTQLTFALISKESTRSPDSTEIVADVSKLRSTGFSPD